MCLTRAWHDVLWCRSDMAGAKDRDVLARGVAENRILVTFDKDFGELVFHSGLPASSGIILFRIPMASPAYVAQKVLDVLESRSDWAGTFSVVEQDRLRMIRLPDSTADEHG